MNLEVKRSFPLLLTVVLYCLTITAIGRLTHPELLPELVEAADTRCRIIIFCQFQF